MARPRTLRALKAEETDVVIIGSGIGGLCCAAVLSHYGVRTVVCEAHYHAGGAAHAFDAQGASGTFQFDAGPSFHAGLSATPSSNPLKQVLDLVGAEVPCVTYDRWIVHDPSGESFPCIAGASGYRANILRQGGPVALAEWEALEREMAPLQAGAALFPAAAMRADRGAVLTVGKFALRAGLAAARAGLHASTLTGPFSAVVDKVVTDPWLRRFIDLECFVLSGMLAKDTLCAEMAFMFMERNKPGASIDFPLGGSAAVVDALVDAIERRGGEVRLRCPVEGITVEGGRATGVQLRSRHGTAQVLRASRAVVSNASVWDTLKLVPKGAVPPEWARAAAATPRCDSFMHLHLGIDASGLPEDLQCHHLIVNDWADIAAEQNVVIVSIPTVFDASLAPAGRAAVHVYGAANEPWSRWEGIDRGSSEYKALKDERAQPLWRALERVIPDVRQRVEVKLLGTPRTHARYLRRSRGTYGPAISAQRGTFPGPSLPLEGLYGCGDSYMPGIGVPAAAASGMIAANTLVPVGKHLQMLEQLRLV